MKDLYYILGVGKGAAPAEIDKAYAVLSARLKPAEDETSAFLQNHFNEVTEAYSILSNPAKRRIYDATLKRNHLKQLARFKAKTTNAFIAVSVILITGLFGFYLVNLINGHKAVKKVKNSDTVVAVEAPPKKHHKHKHHSKALIAHAVKPTAVPAKPATPAVLKPAAKPGLAAITKPVKVLADTVKRILKRPVLANVAKPAPVTKDTMRQVKNTVAAAPIKHLVLVKATSQPVTVKPDSSYITYLKNNLRDSVYMHQLADYMSPVVSVLASNAKVRVLEKGRSFYKVASNRQTGYIPRWALLKP